MNYEDPKLEAMIYLKDHFERMNIWKEHEKDLTLLNLIVDCMVNYSYLEMKSMLTKKDSDE